MHTCIGSNQYSNMAMRCESKATFGLQHSNADLVH